MPSRSGLGQLPSQPFAGRGFKLVALTLAGAVQAVTLHRQPFFCLEPDRINH
jgi:hypothetical protein